MPRVRPTSVLVMAICHFIVGGIGGSMVCCNTIQIAAGGAIATTMIGTNAPVEQQKAIQEKISEEVPFFLPYIIATVSLGWILTSLLIIAGLGLLKMWSMGWTVSVVYAVTSLLMKVGIVVYMVLYFAEPMQRIMVENMKNQPMPNPQAAQQVEQVAKVTGGVMRVVMVGMPIGMMIYPLAVLIVMMSPSVRAAFRGEGTSPTAGLEDYYDPTAVRDVPDR